jgi:hypothetical protein
VNRPPGVIVQGLPRSPIRSYAIVTSLTIAVGTR